MALRLEQVLAQARTDRARQTPLPGVRSCIRVLEEQREVLSGAVTAIALPNIKRRVVAIGFVDPDATVVHNNFPNS